MTTRSGTCLRAAAASLVIVLSGAPLGACANDDLPITRGRNRDIQITEVRDGQGPAARDGREISVHYVGMMPDGEVFMTTRRNARPHTWIVGDGTVIAGMDIAVRGMAKGGVRRVLIPPELHWGDGNYGGKIPPHTWLTFEIEMVSVR